MADPFGRFARGYTQGRQLRNQEEQLRMQEENALLNRATSTANLVDSGYVPSRDRFGNMMITRDSSMGQGAPEGYVRFGGKLIADKNYVSPYQRMQLENKAAPKPMNELQQVKLESERQKQAEAAEKKSLQEEGLRDSATDMLSTIQAAKKGVDSKYFGRFGDLPTVATPSVFSDKAYGERTEWESNINKLLANRVIGIMNEMKRASKTGATGFGQLNRSELQLLKDSATALNRRLTPEVAEKYLSDLERIYQKVLGGNGQPSVKSESMKTYSSPEEADANEALGTIVMVRGKRYQV